MKDLKSKGKTPDAVEKADGLYRLKPKDDARAKHADDLSVLSKGGLKVDELAAVVGHLLERVKALEEG